MADPVADFMAREQQMMAELEGEVPPPAPEAVIAADVPAVSDCELRSHAHYFHWKRFHHRL